MLIKQIESLHKKKPENKGSIQLGNF
jgi:hypothetical protein